MTKMAHELNIEMSLAGIFPGAKATYIESIITKVGATVFCPICSEVDFLRIKREEKAAKGWDKLHPKAKENIWAWQRKRK